MTRSEETGSGREMRRRRRSYSELEDGRLYKSRGEGKTALEPDIPEVRRIRVERLEGSTSTRRSAATAKMTSDSHATLPSVKSALSHRRKHDPRRSLVSKKHRTKRKSTSRDDSTPTYVYGDPADRAQASRSTISESRKLSRDAESIDTEEDKVEDDAATQSEAVREKPNTKKIRVVYVERHDSKSPRPSERRVKSDKKSRDRPRDSHESIRSSRVHTTRRKSIPQDRQASLPSRSASTGDLPLETRPSPRRSATTSSHVPTVKFPYEPSFTDTNDTGKRSSFLRSFFSPVVPQQSHHEPEKLVECLTCSDAIPRSKSAKLQCGHRMCHSCLKRIFKLSVTDPQHMPPKCCTANHIPLKHVERLFDNKFKKNWNLKFAEYSTKNRIYCPARRCGEWIKPGNIHKEDGIKYGKCSRCKAKVCCLCNRKWHGSKDCPKDEEINKLLEAAKQAGWQRCYSCRTMVELKEGCNHMTCHCTAEFCMICGLKWKSCNCPWFNYEPVEADRLNHMQVPVAADQPEQPNRLRRQRPNYRDEINQRRRQERADEELARRLQRVAVEEDDDDDYQGGIGEIHGVGNGAGHFMNQDYIRAARNILTGNFDHATAAANYVMGVAQARGAAPPPPPVMRRHTMRDRAYNAAPTTRPSERVVPRRIRTDYAAEAAVHAPVRRGHQRTASAQEAPTPRPSVLAGLGGTGSGGNRVNAWRTHVEPGVAPAEGVLSM